MKLDAKKYPALASLLAHVTLADSDSTRLKKSFHDLNAPNRFDKATHEKLKKDLETEKDPEMREALEKEIKRQLALK